MVAAAGKTEGREDRVLSYSSSRGKWPMGRCLKGRLNIWRLFTTEGNRVEGTEVIPIYWLEH